HYIGEMYLVTDEKNNAGISVTSTTTDAFGSKTFSTSTQQFTVVGGQAKLERVQNGSTTYSIDGSKTITDKYWTVYSYYGQAGKAGADGFDTLWGASPARDGSGLVKAGGHYIGEMYMVTDENGKAGITVT